MRVAADDRDELHPPKSGRSRVIDLGDDVLAELTNQRLLKKQVFADED